MVEAAAGVVKAGNNNRIRRYVKCHLEMEQDQEDRAPERGGEQATAVQTARLRIDQGRGETQARVEVWVQAAAEGRE